MARPGRTSPAGVGGGSCRSRRLAAGAGGGPRRQRKKGVDAGLAGPWQTHAGGQNYSVGLILCVLTLVVDSGVSLRGAPRVLEVVRVQLGLTVVLPEVPDWTTVRNWLLRIGLYLVQRPKVITDDWVWFVDHSCQ